MLSLDDAERLSRYAAGELSDDENTAFERELAERVELRDGWRRLQQMDALANASMRAEDLGNVAISRRVLRSLSLYRVKPRPTPIRVLAVACLLVAACAGYFAWGFYKVKRQPAAHQHEAVRLDTRIAGVTAFPDAVVHDEGSREIRLARGSVVVEAPMTVHGPDGATLEIRDLSLVTTEPEKATLHAQSTQPAVTGVSMFALIKQALVRNEWKQYAALSVLSLSFAADAATPRLLSTGEAGELVYRVLREQGEAGFVRCFTEGLRRTPSLDGHGVVRISFNPKTGVSTGARLTGEDAKRDPLYAQCVAQVAAGLSYAPFDSAEQEPGFLWPLDLERGGAVGFRLGTHQYEAPPMKRAVKMPAVDGSPTFGKLDAPVTVVLFQNAECKFCRRHHATELALRQQYGERVRFIFKQRPLDDEQHSMGAALALVAANEQGRYLAFADALADLDGVPDEKALGAAAKKAGLDLARFDQVRASAAAKAQVDRDLAAGDAAQVGGVPSAIINGELIVGAHPLAKFQAAIDAALAESKR